MKVKIARIPRFKIEKHPNPKYKNLYLMEDMANSGPIYIQTRADLEELRGHIDLVLGKGGKK